MVIITILNLIARMNMAMIRAKKKANTTRYGKVIFSVGNTKAR
jgi:hypothetical protein